MKKISLIYLIFFLTKFSVFSQNDSIIYWNENRIISWSDFKITKGFDSRINHKYFAGSSTEIRVDTKISEYNYDTEIIVYAIFHKYSSISSLKTDYLLKHEQLHFDIVELYARKLRKLYFDNFEKLDNDLIESLYLKNSDLLDEYQDLYDKETNHSMNKEKQQIWNEKITKELSELEDFNFENFMSKISF